MTGPEHYQLAEELLVIADHHETVAESARDLVATATAHAILAQAAATAMAGYSDDGMTQEDWTAWNDVAGVEGKIFDPSDRR